MSILLWLCLSSSVGWAQYPNISANANNKIISTAANTYQDNTFSKYTFSRYTVANNRKVFAGKNIKALNTSAYEFRVGGLNSMNNNTFVGTNAGQRNTSGSRNSFFGALSGQNNTSGSRNSFFGALSGSNNTIGSHNAFFGNASGARNTSGSNNSFFGNASGEYNTNGYYNSFFGAFSGASNSSGNDNSFFGYFSGFNNSTGSDNSFFGASSGEYNSTGSNNSFFGHFSGLENTNGYDNSFFGRSSGEQNYSGNNNSFFGRSSGEQNYSGRDNSFFGSSSGEKNLSGDWNVFIGRSSGKQNIRGSENTFVGAFSGASHIVGNRNTFIGKSAGLYNETGENNVFIGHDAGRNNSSGSDNVFLGNRAGFNETGSDKLYIANNSTQTPLIYGDFEENTLTVNGKLGLGTKTPEWPLHIKTLNAGLRIDRDREDPGFALVRYDQGFNNVWKSFYLYTRGNGPNDGKFVIADWGTNTRGGNTPRLVIANNGHVGIGDFLTKKPSQKLTVDGSVLATANFITSDKRFKKNIEMIPQAMESLENIHGVSYAYQRDKFEKRNLPKGKNLGLIAQEVQKVYPELVNEDGEGYLSINYSGLIPVLIEALKEQKKYFESKIQTLESHIELLQPSTDQIKQVADNQANPVLYQNEPNPFDQNTLIKMYLPESVVQASLYIYTMNGQALKQIQINERGNTQVEITKNSLNAGMYLYALIADNQEIDVKRMLLK